MTTKRKMEIRSPHKMPVTPELVKRIKQLAGQAMPRTAIAARLGCSTYTVHRVLKGN